MPSTAAWRQVIRIVRRVVLAAALTGILVAAIRWQATLAWMGEFLVCPDRPEHADLILVMGGDFLGQRVLKGADLGAKGFAPVVLISGPPYGWRPEGELAVEFLVDHGYPR